MTRTCQDCTRALSASCATTRLTPTSLGTGTLGSGRMMLCMSTASATPHRWAGAHLVCLAGVDSVLLAKEIMATNTQNAVNSISTSSQVRGATVLWLVNVDSRFPAKELSVSRPCCSCSITSATYVRYAYAQCPMLLATDNCEGGCIAGHLDSY